MLITFYHLAGNFFTFPGGALIIWICEGFDTNLARNLSLWGFEGVSIPSMVLNCFIPINIYFLTKWYHANQADPETYAQIDYMNQINFMIIMICRSMVICVKYATYSPEHFEVLRSCRLSFNHLSKSLIYF